MAAAYSADAFREVGSQMMDVPVVSGSLFEFAGSCV